MQSLSNGYKKPENGDKGATVFNALADNITLLNNHTHDGTDGELIDHSSIIKPTQTLLAASWVANGLGTGYTQTVSCPGTTTLDKVTLRFRVKSGALQHVFVHPTVVPSSLTSFVVTMNRNDLELECLFV